MKSDEQLLEEIERASAGLLFVSEADYPLRTIRWEGAAEPSPRSLREAAGAAEDAPVEVQSLERFFRGAAAEPEWKDEKARAAARRYQALARLLQESLRDLKVYRVGRVNIAVFILGRSPGGRWLGVSTRVVET